MVGEHLSNPYCANPHKAASYSHVSFIVAETGA